MVTKLKAKNKIFDSRAISMTITVIAIALILIYEAVGFERIFGAVDDPDIKLLTDMTVTRALGGVVFFTIVLYLGYRVNNPFVKPFWKSLLFTLPAFAVVINNLPIYPLMSSMATVTDHWSKILLLVAECFCIGFFEEYCFRGMVFLGFLEKRRDSVKGRFLAIIFTSAVFGAVHAVNLFLGASPVAVLMQIGYSFLIGAMCSVVLIKTANLWMCVILHGVFDFCGALVPTCGKGIIWEPFTITVTVVIAVAVTVYMTVAFFKIKTEEVDRIYPILDKKEK